MHPFFILSGLLHATALAVIGFFVLFTAGRAGGYVKTIGNVLGAWLFILAVLAIIGSVLAPTLGRGPWGSGMMGAYSSQMMGTYPRPWMQSWPPTAVPPPATAPAAAPPASK